MAKANSANFEPTVRSTQISRGRLVDRTSLESLDSARIDVRSTALVHCHGSIAAEQEDDVRVLAELARHQHR